MLVHGIRLGITAVLAASFASAAAAGCQLQQLGTLPIDMEGLHPMVKTRINGIAARFELDSGSFYSMIWRGAASRYRLPVRPVMGDSYYVSGMGGSEKASETTVRSFQFLGFPVSNAKFLVVNGGGSAGESVGLIGENLLRVSDVEYDLANGVVRFFKPTGCNGHPLAYWAVSTPYTSVKLDNLYVADYHLSATAIVDGHRMTVWLDTGSPRSFLSLSAAARIGITPDSPGVTFLGTGGGIGPGVARMWDARSRASSSAARKSSTHTCCSLISITGRALPI
jgi:predicted aspartyl protease